MKENGIPKKTRFLWQVRICLIGFIPVAVLLFLCSVTLWCLLPAVILAAALLIFVLWYIPAYFASYEILFPKGAIIINRGTFIRNYPYNALFKAYLRSKLFHAPCPQYGACGAKP